MKIFRWVALLLMLFSVSFLISAQEVTDPPPDGEIEIDVDEVREGVEDVAEEAVDTTETVAEASFTFLQDLTDRLATAPENDLLRIVFVIGGAILLLLGWRVYDEVIILAGILVGAAVASGVVPDSNTVLEIAALLIGGIIGALLAIFLYYIAVFFIGAYVGLLLTYTVINSLLSTTVSDVVLLVGALLGGVLLVVLSAELLVLLSAIVGAQMLVVALGLNPEWILILALVGIVIQFAILRSMKINLRRRPRRNYRKILFG